MSNYWRYINIGFGLWLSVEHSHNALHKYKSPGPIELPSVTPRLRLKCNPTSLQTVPKNIWYIIVLLHEAIASQGGRCHSDFQVGFITTVFSVWTKYVFSVSSFPSYNHSFEDGMPVGVIYFINGMICIHRSDVIMSAMASQITDVSSVCSTVCSDADKNHQSSASLASVRGIHRWPVDSPHKGPVTRKMFPFADVIML